jgi:3-hydroxyacyl-[acyl-carrier-protein] dehydratase
LFDEEPVVARKPLILDFSEFDENKVIADIEEIRRVNPQRFEMEQLTAICYEDFERNICAGYKDITDQEFWVRGHMPGMPLMPGVIMCEAAAQLASYVTGKRNLMGGMIGFGGLEEVRFRDVVRPGDRLLIVVRLLKVRRSLLTCEFQCLKRRNLVCEGIIMGTPLPVELLKQKQP